MTKPKVIRGFPPNYNAICRAIPFIKKQKTTIFAYGDAIYTPYVVELRPDLLIHEGAHISRQTDPAAWWDQYLSDVDFRLREEVIAYSVQYEYAKKYYNRQTRRKLLATIAADLASPMYGSLVDKERAIKLITREEVLSEVKT